MSSRRFWLALSFVVCFATVAACDDDAIGATIDPGPHLLLEVADVAAEVGLERHARRSPA